MPSDEEQDTTVYAVVANHEEQYSIWPKHKAIPQGNEPRSDVQFERVQLNKFRKLVRKKLQRCQTKRVRQRNKLSLQN